MDRHRPSSSAAARWMAGMLLSILLNGCAMYNKPYPVVVDPKAPFELKIVQADDYGSFWDRTQAQSTLDEIKAQSKAGNTLVVLFIHGWHHNAHESDENLEHSKETLAELYKLLDTPERAELRRKLTGRPDFKLTGIYVGWRGRSLPGLLDYATIWGRKNAAERVGNGDVSEFIERLQRIFLQANAKTEKSSDPTKTPFMGLVTIGHSLGAQVLWKSLYRSLEMPLVERAPCFSNILEPQFNVVGDTVRVPINSLGDLNILLNPALEAYQFARVDALYRQLRFPRTQTPQVVVFSADNDRARQTLFPLARAVSSPFRPNFRSDGNGYQGKLWGRALGEAVEQQTHTLARAEGRPDSLTQAVYNDQDEFAKFDFTDDTTFDGIRLQPVQLVPEAPPRVPYSPVLVVQTQDKIVNGHNGIFERDFRLFLSKYIAYIEGKRILLRRQRQLAAVTPEPVAAPACVH